jgi:hypothetical protein
MAQCWCFLINEVSLRQTIVAPGLMGRVNSSAGFLRSIARLSGVLVAGVAGEIIGLQSDAGSGRRPRHPGCHLPRADVASVSENHACVRDTVVIPMT